MIKYGYYQYKVDYHLGICADGSSWKGWVYEIHNQHCKPELVRESGEWYDTPDEAKFAAKEHIDLLENGEG